MKIKWIVATEDYEISDTDKTDALAKDIWLMNEADISYYEKMASDLAGAVKYQFYGEMFRSQSIRGLSGVSVAATKSMLPGKGEFYSFLAKPRELLKLARIDHRSRFIDTPKDTAHYQRMANPSRLKAIGKWLDDGNVFPTNIVINVSAKKSLAKILLKRQVSMEFLW